MAVTESRLKMLVLSTGLAVVLLAAALTRGSQAGGRAEPDVLARLLGGTASVAADEALERAEVYYHGGVGRKCSEIAHKEANQRHAGRLPLLPLVERLHGETVPHAHRHLTGSEERELLPWFVTAARLNPHNIEAWRVGSYWFRRTGYPDRADQFITDGIRHNPRDYRLYLERGILYHGLERWKEAIEDLETAQRLCAGGGEDIYFDRKAIRIYLADSRLKCGREAAHHRPGTIRATGPQN